MQEYTTSATSVTSDIDLDALVSEAWDAVGASFERFSPQGVQATASPEDRTGKPSQQTGK